MTVYLRSIIKNQTIFLRDVCIEKRSENLINCIFVHLEI